MAQDKTSLRGRIWDIKQPVASLQRQLESRGLPSLVAAILSSRGIKLEDLDAYMTPKIKTSLPDPSIFKDMDVGVKHIADDIEAGRKIKIWSDYDCDGVTSATVMKLFFRMIGCGETDVRIPDRISEGYGPNPKGLREVKAEGFDTVCILDAGIVAFEALEVAKEVGLKVVVIDHHAAEENLPPAVAVINANRQDETPGFEHLCAAGMAFVFCVGLARELKNRNWFDGKEGRPDAAPQGQIMDLLAIVALGTVADVVGLTTLNRAFVTRGLDIINRRENIGLCQLAAVAGIGPRDQIVAKDLAWKFGPRINAAGRIDDAMLGVELLCCTDAGEAAQLAKRLDDLNTARKAIEEQATEPAIADLSSRIAGVDRRIAIALVPEAHEGVVGISAGRVKETYDCPAIVLAIDHIGNYKGSARSVKGFDIGQAIIEARNAGLILSGGGHGMAGGLTLKPEKLEAFEAFMNAKIETSDYFRDGVLTQADVQLLPAELTVDLIDSLNRLEPFGMGNPAPRVILEGAEIREVKILKEKHLKVTLVAGTGTLEALMWGAVGTQTGDFLQQSVGHRIDAYGEPGINEFRGNRSPQMILQDVREHNGSLL